MPLPLVITPALHPNPFVPKLIARRHNPHLVYDHPRIIVNNAAPYRSCAAACPPLTSRCVYFSLLLPKHGRFLLRFCSSSSIHFLVVLPLRAYFSRAAPPTSGLSTTTMLPRAAQYNKINTTRQHRQYHRHTTVTIPSHHHHCHRRQYHEYHQ